MGAVGLVLWTKISRLAARQAAVYFCFSVVLTLLTLQKPASPLERVVLVLFAVGVLSGEICIGNYTLLRMQLSALLAFAKIVRCCEKVRMFLVIYCA